MEERITISEVADLLATDRRVGDALRRWTMVRLYTHSFSEAYNQQLLKALEQALGRLGKTLHDHDEAA